MAKKKVIKHTEGTVDLPKAICGSEDHPLIIGDASIPCFVLDDERRVISQRGLKSGIGMNNAGGAQRLTVFVKSLGLNASKKIDLTVRILPR